MVTIAHFKVLVHNYIPIKFNNARRDHSSISPSHNFTKVLPALHAQPNASYWEVNPLILDLTARGLKSCRLNR